jgi:hypothetical protein
VPQPEKPEWRKIRREAVTAIVTRGKGNTPSIQAQRESPHSATASALKTGRLRSSGKGLRLCARLFRLHPPGFIRIPEWLGLCEGKFHNGHARYGRTHNRNGQATRAHINIVKGATEPRGL